MSNRIRARNRDRYDFQDGLQSKGNTVGYVVNTLTELRAIEISKLKDKEIVETIGSAAVNDGLGEVYYWDPINTTADDGNLVIRPITNPTAGRWIKSNTLRSELQSTVASKGAALVGLDDGASGTLWTTLKGLVDKLRSSIGASIIGYKNLGTGSVQRSVQDKLSESISVKDFGAVGDGIADDTDAIQAAVNALQGSNKTLLFPNGRYKISRQGSIVTYGSNTVYFAVRITDQLSVECQGEFVAPCSDTDLCNVFVYDGVTSFSLFCGGFASVKSTANATTRILYANALVLLNACKNVHIENVSVSNLRHAVVVVNSSYCSVRNSKYTRTADAGSVHAGTAFGIYAGEFNSIAGCSVFGGTYDGDLGMFGSGFGNRISENLVFNALESDTTRAIVNTGFQGIFVDSGQNSASIIGNTAYGYYYGIDVKTNIVDADVSSNRLIRNKVGIACRRGETNSPNVNVRISGNSILPQNGNGDSSLIGGYSCLAIWLQDIPGVSVQNNFIGVTYSDPVASQSWCGIYGAITNSSLSQDQGVLISGNKFAFQDNFAGTNRFNSGQAILLSGEINNMLSLDSNTFSPPQATMSESHISLSSFGIASVTNNLFDTISYSASNAPYVAIASCSRVECAENVFENQATAFSVSGTTNQTKITGNVFGSGAGGNLQSTILVDGGGGLTVNNNSIWTASSPPYNDSKFLTVTNQTVENLMFVGNTVRITNFNAATYYSLNGTAAKTGANIVVNNVMIPV